MGGSQCFVWCILFWRRLVLLNLVEIGKVFLLLDCAFFCWHICNIWGRCLHKYYSPSGLGNEDAKTYGRCEGRRQVDFCDHHLYLARLTGYCQLLLDGLCSQDLRNSGSMMAGAVA